MTLRFRWLCLKCHARDNSPGESSTQRQTVPYNRSCHRPRNPPMWGNDYRACPDSNQHDNRYRRRPCLGSRCLRDKIKSSLSRISLQGLLSDPCYRLFRWFPMHQWRRPPFFVEKKFRIKKTSTTDPRAFAPKYESPSVINSTLHTWMAPTS